MNYEKFNFYKYKNYKYFVILPLLLFFIGIYFIPHIAFDSSLRGGIEIQIQTNSITNVQNLTAMINAKIPEAEASVSPATGGYDINIAANGSLSTAESQLVSLYSYYSNYSKESAIIAAYQNIKQPNSTITESLSSETANQTRTLQELKSEASSIILTLKPLLNKTYSIDSASPQEIVNITKNAYYDANSNYKSHILSILYTIIPYSSYTYQETTATLGAYFLQQLEYIIISSFIIVAIVAFIIFRSPAPSISVVFGAVNDLVVALAGMAIFGIPLGVASIGGLLMLIGYSMDTDVLAAIRILKRTEGLPEDRAFSTMKTGLTMTSAAIITFLILFITAYLSFIPTYFEISSVVLIGLFGDIITTWFGDTIFILWYKEHIDSKLK
jgi:preprotein translocase subunit SecF